MPTPGIAANTFVFEHSMLGSMSGLISADTPDVVRFRALPYATIRGRFKQSILRKEFDGLSRDFTKAGYACPHTYEMDDVNSGGLYPGQEMIEASESESLILELNVPRSQLESMKNKNEDRLAVMTYAVASAILWSAVQPRHHNVWTHGTNDDAHS